MEILPTCPDCGAEVGQQHSENCDVQICSVCKGQRYGCDCEGHDPDATVWTGGGPGKAECRELGWYAIMVPGRGWQPCSLNTPGAREDLNRWAYYQQLGTDGLYKNTN